MFCTQGIVNDQPKLTRRMKMKKFDFSEYEEKFNKASDDRLKSDYYFKNEVILMELEYEKVDIDLYWITSNSVSRTRSLKWLLPIIEEIVDDGELVFEKQIKHPYYIKESGEPWIAEIWFYTYDQMNIYVN